MWNTINNLHHLSISLIGGKRRMRFSVFIIPKQLLGVCYFNTLKKRRLLLVYHFVVFQSMCSCDFHYIKNYLMNVSLLALELTMLSIMVDLIPEHTTLDSYLRILVKNSLVGRYWYYKPMYWYFKKIFAYKSEVNCHLWALPHFKICIFLMNF